MDVREKLVQLLKTSACPSTFICDPTCKYYGFEDCFPERFADYLITNGVTVQEWISVDDRLPEPFKSVLVFRDGKISIDYNEGNGWFAYDFNGKRVTHWMPMPPLPKGETNNA